MRFVLASLLLFSATASAQIFSAGVRGGVPFGSDGFRNYTVGPTVEFKPPILPFRFVADGLYKRLSAGQDSISVWEIPLMVRFELPTPFAKPFIGGGPTFRRFSISGDGSTQNGFVAGTGIRLTVPFIKITPEFRFSHFRENSFRGTDNQGEFLIGITF
jgi:hypothetical protein